jgi:hypothetical protein
VLKIDNKRDDTVFVSHNGLTLFFNKRKNKETGETFYSLNVHVNKGTYENKQWEKIADMILTPENLTDLNSKLAVFNS